MTDDTKAIIEGSKGGGGGGKGGGSSNTSGGAVESPNTLRSNARARVIELLGEGEIVGLVNGAKSIYFDKTPLQNADNSLNFQGVEWDTRVGLPDQTYLNGFTQVETYVSVETQVKVSTGPVIRSIADSNADAVRVTIRLPSLASQDTSTGNLNPASVSYAIDVRPNGGTWTQVVAQDFINQKCTSPYQVAHRIPLSQGGNPWQIRVRRITADSTSVYLQNDVFWESYTVLVEGKFTFPNTALMAINVSAQQFGGQLPARAYEVKGLKIKVPTNYDPIARTYTGIWNGTFKTEWSNNPAWVLYDLLTTSRYGLGEFIDATKIDKWSLYAIAKYCDELVPDGYGNQEPRFVFNTVINSREEAFKVIQSIAGAFRGMAFWSLGQVFAVSDMPEDPVTLVTPANVIDGKFEYSGTAMKARHSVALVSWNDPEDFYNTAIELVQNDDALELYGWRQVEIQAVGCTSRGQAHRFGKWVLDTEQNETETVTYEASWDHINVRPGNIIMVADPRKAQVRLGGRLDDVPAAWGSNPALYKLDAAFTPESGESYNLIVVLPDGSLHTSPITAFSHDNFGVTLSDLPTTRPITGAMWVITGSDITPRRYRVLSVAETDAHTVRITALFHDPTKFARVEQDIILDPLPYSRPRNIVAGVKNVSAVESRYVDATGLPRSKITCSWTPGSITNTNGTIVSDIALSYVVAVQTPDKGFIELGTVSSPTIDLNDTIIGTYKFYITAISAFGKKSTPVEFSFTAVGHAGLGEADVIDIGIDGVTGNEFTGRDVRIRWTNAMPAAGSFLASTSEAVNPLYKNNTVKVYHTASATLLRTETIVGSSYLYTYEKNTQDNLAYGRTPQRDLTFKITINDVYDRVTTERSFSVNNPTPVAVTPILTVSSGTLIVNYPQPTDLDWAGVVIWVSETPGFNPLVTTPKYTGSANSVPIGVNPTTNYVRMGTYDAFGQTGMNISAQQSITIAPVIDVTAPATPTNLVLTTSITVNTDGTVNSKIAASWTANTESDIAGYIVAAQEASGNFVEFMTSTNTYVFNNLTPGVAYTIKVKAFDRFQNVSGFTAQQTITTAANATPPDPASGLVATSALRTAFLTWSNPSNRDLGTVEVWSATVNNRASAALIAVVNGTSFTHSGLSTGTTYYYWIRTVNTSGTQGSFFPASATAGVAVTPGTLSGVEFDTSLRPVESVGTLPSTGNFDGRIVYLTTDKKIYRFDGTSWVSTVPTTDLTGVLADAQLAINSINANKLVPESITDVQVAPGAITAVKILDGTVTGAKIANDTITNAQIANNAVETAKIADQAISALKLADNSVNTTKIVDGNITTVKIADQAVTATRLADDNAATVDPDPLFHDLFYWNLANLTNVGAYYGTGPQPRRFLSCVYPGTLDQTSRAFPIEKFAYYRIKLRIYIHPSATGWIGLTIHVPWVAWYNPAPVTYDAGFDGGGYPFIDLATTTIPKGYWVEHTGIIQAAHENCTYMQFRTRSNLTSAYGFEFAWEIVRATANDMIVDSAITTSKLSAGAVTANKIAAGTITANEIASGTITADRIAAYTITADRIAANTITGDRIAGNTISADKILANSITAGQIAAGTITATQIAAGTITADRLGVGISNNRALNSDMTAGTSHYYAGWTSWGSSPVASLGFETNVWRPYGMNTAYATVTGTPPNGSVFDCYHQVKGIDGTVSNFPIVAGKRYEFSYYASIHRCTAQALIIFLDASDNHIVIYYSDTHGEYSVGPASLAAWPRLSVFATAPSNAVRALLVIRSIYDGRDTPYVFFTGVYFGEATPNQTELTPWSSTGTVVDGSRIVTGSLHANRITAYTIGADRIVSNSLTTDQIAANTITAWNIATNTITADRIAGNTITGDKIASNTISADKIAVNSITADQIAGSTIVGWNIAGNTITADKITSNTITANQIAGSTIVGWNIAGNTLTGDHIIGNSIHGNRIISNTITAGQIVAGTITATELAAGSVLASKIGVGLSRNMALNSDTAAGLIHYELGWRNWSGGPTPQYTVGWDPWQPLGMKAIALHVPGNPSGIQDIYHKPKTAGNSYQHFPVVAGQRYEFSYYVSVHRCDAYAGLLFFADDGTTQLLNVVGNAVGENPASGRLASWPRASVFATAPSNAAYVMPFIRAAFSAAQSDPYIFFTAVHLGDATPNQTELTPWSPAGGTIIDGTRIITGTINADKIIAGTITGDRFNTGTSLPGTITVGSSGVSIDTVQSRSSDPASRINAVSTTIDPGRILIAGGTTLASWRNGSDATKIEGGAIYANSITANKLRIGNRGISTVAIDFQVERTTNTYGRVKWTSGYMLWEDDSGATQSTLISAGSADYASYMSWLYIYWTKGTGYFQVTTNWSGAIQGDNVILAQWTAYDGLAVTYGGLILDGNRITAGTITANQIAANSITADRIVSNSITATQLAANSIAVSKLAVTGENKVLDPFFDSDEWGIDGGLFFESNNQWESIGARRYTVWWSGAGGGPANGRRHLFTAGWILVAPGQPYRIRCKIWNSSNQNMHYGINFYNNVGGYVSGSFSSVAPGFSGYASYGNIVPPANVAYGKIFIFNEQETPGFSGLAFVSDVSFGPMVGSAYIEDAAITTAKIGNLQVDTIKIKDGAVSAFGYIDATDYPAGYVDQLLSSSPFTKQITITNVGANSLIDINFFGTYKYTVSSATKWKIEVFGSWGTSLIRNETITPVLPQDIQSQDIFITPAAGDIIVRVALYYDNYLAGPAAQKTRLKVVALKK